MPSIHVLPDLLVNKIAAGEVIERPASVVKELVENSLDAGARRIGIEIEQGGRKLIRVVDDGGGMERDDVELSVRPHATSKILREDDLFAIRTMGFRGEALASVGAVAQLRVLSRRADSDEGYEVRVAGDRIEPVTAAAAPTGTSIEVRELFFNVPARQKFLRTPQTEISHISEQLARVALVHPHVEFRLTHNGRDVHHLRATDGMRPRIADFFGQELADALLEVSRDERGVKIHGYVARPAESRSSAKWQYLFLNRRYIRDRFLGHAVREAYRGLVEVQRYPVVFLALEVPPDAVDVNVHPTKIEVRWRDSSTLYSQMLSVLRDRFLRADLTPSFATDRAEADAARREMGLPTGEEPDADDADDEAAAARRQQIRESIAAFFKKQAPRTADSPPAFSPPSAFTTHSPPDSETAGQRDSRTAGWRDGGMQELYSSESLRSSVPPSLRQLDHNESAGDPIADWSAILSGTLIQLHRTYIAAETPDGMIIVDQHALHERILFEQLAEQVSRGPLESQRLLIPDVLDVSPDQVGLIDVHAEPLGRLGFELTAYGPSAVAVHAAPTILKEGRVLDFLRDLLDRLSGEDGPVSTETLTNDLLSMMACKAAVKAGDPLSPEEMRALMSHRERVERSSNCPHGRPTSLRLTLRDLERQFKRA